MRVYVYFMAVHWTPSLSFPIALVFLESLFSVTSSFQLCARVWVCVVLALPYSILFCSIPFYFCASFFLLSCHLAHKSKLTRWKYGLHTYPISPHAFSRNFHIRDFLPETVLCVFGYDLRINKLLSVLWQLSESKSKLNWHCVGIAWN